MSPSSLGVDAFANFYICGKCAVSKAKEYEAEDAYWKNYEPNEAEVNEFFDEK